MSPREVRRLPLAEVFCYQAAIYQRHEIGCQGPSFTERDIIKSLKF